MEITNQKLQDKFINYIDGETLEWELARIFYSQNGGFARRTSDKERAIGLHQKEGSIVIDHIKITQTENGMEAEVDDSIQLQVQTPEEHGKLKYLVDYAYQTTDKEELNDPDHQDSMIS